MKATGSLSQINSIRRQTSFVTVSRAFFTNGKRITHSYLHKSAVTVSHKHLYKRDSFRSASIGIIDQMKMPAPGRQ